jgi:hypothetical protein
MQCNGPSEILTVHKNIQHIGTCIHITKLLNLNNLFVTFYRESVASGYVQFVIIEIVLALAAWSSGILSACGDESREVEPFQSGVQ